MVRVWWAMLAGSLKAGILREREGLQFVATAAQYCRVEVGVHIKVIDSHVGGSK